MSGPDAPPTQSIRLSRWSCTTGSNVQSRGVVIVESGDHQWHGTKAYPFLQRWL